VTERSTAFIWTAVGAILGMVLSFGSGVFKFQREMLIDLMKRMIHVERDIDDLKEHHDEG
jgi:hypothetical protein